MHTKLRDPNQFDSQPTDDSVETAARESAAFVQKVVDDAAADGVVVAMSGGLDSTTAATLAVEALGTEAVYGLVLPTDANTVSNVDDAQRVAFDLGIDFWTVDLQPVLSRFEEAMTREPWLARVDSSVAGDRASAGRTAGAGTSYRETLGNAAARLRMTAAYFEANARNRLVLGTGNRTELLLGYHTKHGDGGVDLLPLGDRYKTEVRALARHLDVPEHIVEKSPTAGLWEGQTDEDELGASYETIDEILEKLVDERVGVEETAAALDIDRDLVERFAGMCAAAEHKRTAPPTPTTYP